MTASIDYNPDMQPNDQLPPEGRGRHPIDILPPDSSPMTLDPSHPAFGDDVPFWKPGWIDWAKYLGWRWILFLPAVAVLMAIVGMFWMLRLNAVTILTGGKLLLFCVGIAVTAAGTALRSAMKNRKDPFCIHCGYDLIGLPDGHCCPECGRPFSLRLIDEYRRDPDWFIQRYKHRKDAPMADVPFHAGPVARKKSRDGT